MVELLFWPALVAYGEAAVALVGERRGDPGLAGRLATWGVRIGWLVADGLLVVQAARRRRASRGRRWAGVAQPASSGSSSARYLIWGCRPRYRLLGLAVMPLAARAARDLVRGRRRRRPDGRPPRDLFLALHVGARARRRSPASRSRPRSPRFYLWQERRLKRRDGRASCACGARRSMTLERLSVAGRSRSRSPLLTAGIGIGIVRLSHRRRHASTRRWPRRSSPGRSTPPALARATAGARAAAAHAALAGFALVIVVALACSTHFA